LLGSNAPRKSLKYKKAIRCEVDGIGTGGGGTGGVGGAEISGMTKVLPINSDLGFVILS
jgi:hypothetical protein